LFSVWLSIFIITILTYKYGNAGTAAGFVRVVLPETAGDSFRQLSDKSNPHQVERWVVH
jgi:hypothetical protein